MDNLITVIVATYKKVEGLIPTLESIRLQKYAKKELVVTDDGSGNEIVDVIQSYIDKYRNDFYDVQFIDNKVNSGTVKNVHNAYKKAKGTIIKTISPGDLLYDRNVLTNINDFFNKHKPLIACGIPRTYKVVDNKVIDTFNFNFSTYVNLHNKKRTYSNLLFASKYLVGATFIFHKDAFEKENLFLSENIKYAEDLIQLLAVLRGHRIHLMDNYLIWYEQGSGMSTSNDSSFSNKLTKDQLSFYEWLLEEKKLNKKTLQDIRVKYLSFFMKSKSMKFVNYFRNFSFFIFVIIEQFRKTNSKTKIEANHKNILCIQGDGFIDLILENSTTHCID